jgi:hypothetical protein
VKVPRASFHLLQYVAALSVRVQYSLPKKMSVLLIIIFYSYLVLFPAVFYGAMYVSLFLCNLFYASVFPLLSNLQT